MRLGLPYMTITNDELSLHVMTVYHDELVRKSNIDNNSYLWCPKTERIPGRRIHFLLKNFEADESHGPRKNQAHITCRCLW